ncbi:MAG: hypothetical protein SLAVMIC_00963 [uncultured marine phage]|uniref:Uncharacterized protein n=1 Tax=uncultured marine phage TaxID=707152 RepID=A0A8D9FR85_9VIRU|nr:MAG: hypothetical protein SLAVMIC_00963 [uncultured marine phage]
MKQLKEIVNDRERMCKFSHAIAGVLYYKVETDDSIYMFPINMNDRDDVGTATFECEIKAITLMRYIRKAIDQNCLIKIK